MSVYVIVLRNPARSSTSSVTTATTAGPSGTGYPTTTGEPNCFDASSFDGSVNDNYLILCDTDLPGFDLDAVAAQDLAECIDMCRSTPPGGMGERCVAVEYDLVSAFMAPKHSLTCL